MITDVVARHCDVAAPDPKAPGAFRFSESGSLATILEEAGAVNVRERLLNFQIAAPISQEEFWSMRSETSGTLREKLMTLSHTDRASIAQEVEDAVARVFSQEPNELPARDYRDRKKRFSCYAVQDPGSPFQFRRNSFAL